MMKKRLLTCLLTTALSFIVVARSSLVVVAQDAPDTSREPAANAAKAGDSGKSSNGTKSTADPSSTPAKKSAGDSKGFEDFVDGGFKFVNGFVEGLLFWDASFGAFKSQVIDDVTGLPKVSVVIDEKTGEPKVGKDGKPVTTPVEDGPEFAFMVVVLVIGSVFFTLRFGFINLRGFKHAIDVVRGKYDNPEDKGEISHFRALTSALSATVGLGNIAGVALAVTIGGPGAVFWMMLLAVFGMSAKFTSCTLAQLFRKTNEDGSISGGPMFYIDIGFKEKGKNWGKVGKVLAIMFALMCIGGALGGGNMFQANQSFEALTTAFDIETVDAATQQANPWPARIFGIVLAALVAMVVIGGIKRIGAATSKIVPLMCGLYVIGAMVIILTNIGEVPNVVRAIFGEAFTGQAAYGGFIGVLVWGFKRAAFSNEAGLGSASIAHSAAKTDEPVREGMVAMLGPFIDTIVICFMTACVVLITGAYNDPALVIGDEPAKIVHTSVINVAYNEPKVVDTENDTANKDGQANAATATIELSIGTSAGVRDGDTLVIQRRDQFVAVVKLTTVKDGSSLGAVMLKVKEPEGDDEKAIAESKKKIAAMPPKARYTNLPEAGDRVLGGPGVLKGFDKDSPKQIMAGIVLDPASSEGHVKLNLGSQHGVAVGTRIHIHRGSKYLGLARATLVDAITCEAKLDVPDGQAAPKVQTADGVLTAKMTSKGVDVTMRGFSSLSPIFASVLSICIVLFAYSTMISWCYYGERAWGYLFGLGSILVFRIIFIIFVFLGSVMKLGQVLNFSDLMILCMAFPNIIGAAILTPIVKRKLQDYWSRYKAGEMTPRN